MPNKNEQTAKIGNETKRTPPLAVPSVVKEANKHADAIVLELALHTPNVAHELAACKRLPTGESLDQNLPKSVYRRLADCKQASDDSPRIARANRVFRRQSGARRVRDERRSPRRRSSSPST